MVDVWLQNKIIGTGIAGKPSTIIRLSEHLEYINEYEIPVGKDISSFSTLFLPNKVLFPYLGGEYIGLDNIAFYGIKLWDSFWIHVRTRHFVPQNDTLC